MLTDEELADIKAKLDAIENEYRPECIHSNYGNGCAGATYESLQFWRAATERVPLMLAEIRDRRLSDEDRETFAFVLAVMFRESCTNPNTEYPERCAMAVEVIERLLKRSWRPGDGSEVRS